MGIFNGSAVSGKMFPAGKDSVSSRVLTNSDARLITSAELFANARLAMTVFCGSELISSTGAKLRLKQSAASSFAIAWATSLVCSFQ